jgi:hypothetical protein
MLSEAAFTLVGDRIVPSPQVIPEEAPVVEESVVEQPAPSGTASPKIALADTVPRASWTARLLVTDEAPITVELRRAAIGLSLASLYGFAIGARAGGLSFLRHAVGVPAALVAIAVVGAPALAIALALVDAPIEPLNVARSAARSAASGGLLLATLAPAAALYVVSSNTAQAAGLAAGAGLFFGAAITLKRFLRDLTKSMTGASPKARAGATLAFFLFSVFAAALAMRVWWAVLPVLGGSR